jgi:hypothetical protein
VHPSSQTCARAGPLAPLPAGPVIFADHADIIGVQATETAASRITLIKGTPAKFLGYGEATDVRVAIELAVIPNRTLAGADDRAGEGIHPTAWRCRIVIA